MAQATKTMPAGTARRELIPPYPLGFTAWLLQRVTAVLLAVFLGIHIAALHYFLLGQHITFDRVVERFQSPFFVVVDIGILIAAAFHGLNGIRAVLLDLPIPPAVQKAAFWLLVVIGIVGVAYGTNGLMAFL